MKPNKKYGFKKFICRIENKEPYIPVKFCDLPPLEIFSFDAIRKVLNGEFDQITHGFPWRNSPQGERFWANIRLNSCLDKLPKEAEDFLNYLLDPNNTINKEQQENPTKVSLKNWKV